jgi:hypothetical protein
MGAHSSMDAAHPYFASIPDPKLVEGLRAYREPEVPHPLQITFLEAEGELAWIEDMRSLLAAGRADEADARLTAELAGFDGALARLCLATPAEAVILEGWDDLLPILDEWEGPPITAITLGLTNPPDLVFEAGKMDEPDLLLSLYSDEAFPFSRASKADLAAECGKDFPAWLDGEEDVEFHCALSGLAALNTALIHCKHRYFLRDGRDPVEGRAPGGYVEFVLGSWLLATRFLQATERATSEQLPTGSRLITGTVGINADFVTVLGPERTSTLTSAERGAPAQPSFATLRVKPWVRHEEAAVEAPESGHTLRQRLKAPDAEPVEQPRPGFLARLFSTLR